MTLTTVGYGDIYPVTLAGRLVAVVTMFCGFALVGLLMDIVGKTMMVALFGTESVDDEKPAHRPLVATSAGSWDTSWLHCPTSGKASVGSESHEHSPH